MTWLSYLHESQWQDCYDVAGKFIQIHRNVDFLAALSVFEQDIKYLVREGFLQKSLEWRTPFGEMGCQMPVYQLTPKGASWVSQTS